MKTFFYANLRMHLVEHSHPHAQLLFSTSGCLSKDLVFHHFDPLKSSFLAADYVLVLGHQKFSILTYVIGSSVSSFCSSAIMNKCFDRIIALLKLHTHSVLRSCISSISSPRITSKSLTLVLTNSEIAEFEPHSFHELSFWVMLLCEKFDNIHCVNFELVL